MVSLLCSCLSLSAAIPDDAVFVSARIEAEMLEVGREYEILVEVSLSEGSSASAAGIPAPILQIEVPASAELTGQVLGTYQELRENEFLQEPYERLIKNTPARIGFRLLKQPDAGERFGLNVLAYVGPDAGDEDARFFRRRLVLPLSPKAVATLASPTNSHWGKGDLLQIGDKAAAFSLPRADGSKVSLGRFRGKKNVIVTTYRAFW